MDELNALRMTIEEGAEIEAELKMALAGLAVERLKPCSPDCSGHFGPKAQELFRKGLDAYRAETREES